VQDFAQRALTAYSGAVLAQALDPVGNLGGDEFLGHHGWLLLPGFADDLNLAA
jgi:hypothetical protein